MTHVKVRDSDTPADLVFAPGHSLKGAVHLQSGRAVGVVLDETALPQAGTIVLLWPAQASLRQAEALGVTRQSWTDEEGRFEFDRVPSGDWSLQVAGRPNTNRKLRLAPASEVAVVVH